MRTYQELNRHIVPITRFNKGESGKIFDEVSRNGIGIVMKNNHAECILLSPAAYDEMVEAIEDSYWMALAKARENIHTGKPVSMEKVASMFGITEDDIKGAPDVEIE